MIRLDVENGVSEGICFESSADILLIGRNDENDLVLNDAVVSSRHAMILRAAGHYTIRDRQSSNGTAILRNAKRIALDATNDFEALLTAGDAIQLASIVLRVTLGDAPDRTRRTSQDSSRSVTVTDPVPLDIKALLADWHARAEVYRRAHVHLAHRHRDAYREYAAIAQALEALCADEKTRADWVRSLSGLAARLEALQETAPRLPDADDLDADAARLREDLRSRVIASVREPESTTQPPPAPPPTPQAAAPMAPPGASYGYPGGRALQTEIPPSAATDMSFMKQLQDFETASDDAS